MSQLLLFFLLYFVDFGCSHRLKTCYPERSDDMGIMLYDCRRDNRFNYPGQRLVLLWFRNAVHLRVRGNPSDVAILNNGLAVLKRDERRMHMARIRLRWLARGAFLGLGSLRELNIGHNKLTSLRNGLFQNTPFLESLSLYNNRIESITIEAFRSLRRLRYLHLGRNRLTILHRDLFYYLKSLETLLLFGNRIKTVEDYAFRLPSLVELNLQNNVISTYTCNIFSELWNLRRLYAKKAVSAPNATEFRPCVYCPLCKELRPASAAKICPAGDPCVNIKKQVDSDDVLGSRIRMNTSGETPRKQKAEDSMQKLSETESGHILHYQSTRQKPSVIRNNILAAAAIKSNRASDNRKLTSPEEVYQKINKKWNETPGILLNNSDISARKGTAKSLVGSRQASSPTEDYGVALPLQEMTKHPTSSIMKIKELLESKSTSKMYKINIDGNYMVVPSAVFYLLIAIVVVIGLVCIIFITRFVILKVRK